jgi:hypothetical protein
MGRRLTAGSPQESSSLRGPLRAALHYALSAERAEAVEAARLTAVVPRDFVDAVIRQRLSICLAPHLDALCVPQVAVDDLRGHAAQQRMIALGCAVATRESVASLGAAGIDVLAIKGAALSLLSTGDVAARGAGDIDLWVRPEQVRAAVEALKAIGFLPHESTILPDATTWRGRYAQWADFELTLMREGLPLDLHWQLAGVRGDLPTFDVAWRRHIKVDFAGTEVPTLGAEDSFLHVCAHAHRDGWRWMRSLVDIDRLARLNDPRDARLRSRRAVQLSAVITHDATGSEHLRPWMSASHRRATRARRVAAAAQDVAGWGVAHEWTPRSTWDFLRQSQELVGGVGDVGRAGAAFFLPPNLLIDESSGSPRSVLSAVGARLARAGARIARRD